MSSRLPAFTTGHLKAMKGIIDKFPMSVLPFELSRVGVKPGSYANDTTRRRASVLLPFCNRNGVPSILFTLRTQAVGTHKGQVSFPGGHIDPPESPINAALREYREELFGPANDDHAAPEVSILGVCDTIPAITGTLVTPVIGFIEKDVTDLSSFTPNSNEVDRVFTRSIEELLAVGAKKQLEYKRFDKTMTLPYWGKNEDDPEKIWGLTAIILECVLDKTIVPLILNKINS